MKSRNPRSEIVLLIVSVILTLLISLALIRWLAPSLLGIPNDLVLVQSEKEVQPFYENVFRAQHNPLNSKNNEPEGLLNFFLEDPFVKVRAKPLFPDIGGAGPHDLLGFRNTAVPNVADVVLIGDSQTYGNNAIIWKNWPHNLKLLLPAGTSVYSMATGSWAALQYYYAFKKAQYFSPSVIVIAFYTGNDPLETYSLAVASEYWKDFLPDSDIKKYGTPQTHFPPKQNEQWHVTFDDGVETIFVPKLRRSSNIRHKAVDAGYDIMLRVAEKIAQEASLIDGLNIVFTIIPTKEYVYSRKISESNIEIDPDYKSLITDESRRIKVFSTQLKKIDSAVYVDVTNLLMTAALGTNVLYPKDINGHPLAAGYNLIARAVAPAVSQFLSTLADGFYVSETKSGIQRLIYLENDRFWFITNPDSIPAEPKPGRISSAKLAAFRFAGHFHLDK